MNALSLNNYYDRLFIRINQYIFLKLVLINCENHILFIRISLDNQCLMVCRTCEKSFEFISYNSNIIYFPII